MYAFKKRSQSVGVVVLMGLLACSSVHRYALAQPPGHSISPALQERFGLSEPQVHGALGALLVFARERLAKPEFDDLADRIPNAEQIMRDVKARGIVTRPLDSISDYEACLASLGIGQPLASEFAPAVVEYLGAAGYGRERDILWSVLN